MAPFEKLAMSVLLSRSSMRTLGTLFTVFSLSGLAVAECRSTETIPTERRLLRDTGYRHFTAGQYEEAMGCYVAALAAAEALGSKNTSAIVSDLNDIAILSEEMGRYTEARKLYSRELAILEPLGDTAGAAIGEVYLERGGLSLIEGSLGPAEVDLKKAIVLLTRHAGPDDPRIAKALAGLGRLYTESGKYYEASQLLHNAKAIAESGTPRGDAALINILDSEGSLLSRAGLRRPRSAGRAR